MTPLEELQAAHKRLSELRGPVEQWHHINRNGPRIVDDLTQYGGFIAELDQECDADLIVTLHRTIDAQMAVLKAAISDVGSSRQDLPIGHFSRCDEPQSAYNALALARAINGEAS